MSPISVHLDRRKAVWVPKRVASVAVTAALALLASVTIAGASAQNGKNSFVKNYKVDDEVGRRSANGKPNDLTPVIVSLVPGATLPPQFKAFARRNLDIINSVALV